MNWLIVLMHDKCADMMGCDLVGVWIKQYECEHSHRRSVALHIPTYNVQIFNAICVSIITVIDIDTRKECK